MNDDTTNTNDLANAIFSSIGGLDAKQTADIREKLFRTIVRAIDAKGAVFVAEVLRAMLRGVVSAAVTHRLAQINALVDEQISLRLEKEVQALVDEQIKKAITAVKRSL